MICQEFRRVAGADPQHLSAQALQHRDGCPLCAAHLRQLLDMDATILAALRVAAAPAPSPAAAPIRRTLAAAVLADRRRWYALAASIAGGVVVGTLLWASGSRDALAKDAVEHMQHEASALRVTDAPADADTVREVLAKDGIRLRSDPGLVTYVMTCSFRGHEVPHLVVQTSGGPVTVLVLRDERIARTTKFREQGFAGTLVHSGPGGLAVIGATDQQVQEAAARIDAALEWTR